MRYLLISIIVIVVVSVSYYVWKHDVFETGTENITEADGSSKVRHKPTSDPRSATTTKSTTISELTDIDTAEPKPAALMQFIELTKQQNQYAQQGLKMSAEIQPLIKQLTPDLNDQPEKVVAILVPLCGKMYEYHSMFSKLIQVIQEKSSLLESHPIISDELFNSQHEIMKTEFRLLLESQNEKLREDKQFYKDIYCDDVRAQSGHATPG